jgi:hypothetical protein
MFDKANTDAVDYFDRSAQIPLTFGQSFGRGLATSLIAPAAVGDIITNSLSDKPGEGSALNLIKMWHQELENPNSSQAGFVFGNLAGFAINPATYIGGAAIAAPILGAVEKFGITAASSGAARFAAKGSLLGAEFAGQMLPQDIVSNFDMAEDSLDFLGLATSVGENFGVGVAFAGVPFAWGFLRNKMGKTGGAPKEAAKQAAEATAADITKSSLDEALAANNINAAEHEFMSTIQAGGTPSQELLTRVMSESKIPFDPATGAVNVSLLKPENLKALNNTVADAVPSIMDQETKNALNDYIIKGQISSIVENPKILDGLQGTIDHLNERILKKEAHLARYDKAIEPYLRTGLKADATFSQEHVYKLIKAGEDMRGVTIPKQVKSVLKYEADYEQLLLRRKEQVRKIDELEAQLKNPLIEEEGASLARTKRETAAEKLKQIENDLIASEAKAPKLLHPADEIDYLKGTLTGRQFERKMMLNEDFARLSDLTEHWHNAKTLHKRVLREEMYEQQAAYRDIAQSLVDLGKNPDMLKGSNDAVTNYLRNKIQGKVKREIVSRETENVQIEQTFDDLEKAAVTDESREAIAMARKRVADLEKPEALKNFMDCVIGVAK